MIGLDTNILVRYLTRDDPAQFQEAAALIAALEAKQEGAFISQVALCETVWVLERSYRVPKEHIVETLDRLLQTSVFVIESRAQVATALELYRTSEGSLADELIAVQAHANGCAFTATFDRPLHAQADLFQAPAEALRSLRRRDSGRRSARRHPPGR